MSTDADAPVLMSASQIADLENLRLHQVTHVVRKLKIKPAYVFGNCHVYAADDVARIRAELALIEQTYANRRRVGDDAPAMV